MPSLQGRLTITGKSWEVNGRTTGCAGPVSALAGIWLKANETEISAAPVDPCGSAKTLLWITYLCVYIFQLCFVWTVDQAVQQQPALTLIRQDSTLALSDVPHVLELTKQDTTHAEELSELEVSIKTAERIRSVTHAVLWFISVILWSPTSLPVKLHQSSFLATTRRSHRQLHGLQSSSLDLPLRRFSSMNIGAGHCFSSCTSRVWNTLHTVDSLANHSSKLTCSQHISSPPFL